MLKKAIIVGASGLVGNQLLHILLQQSYYNEVLLLARKELPIDHSKLLQLVVDFNDLDKWSASITGHAIFCCLGTTKAQTPDPKEYRNIDQHYPIKLAQIAKKNGIDQFHFISAVGANKRSSSVYLKLKGETEAELEELRLKNLQIYQPSLLTGNRKESRLAEQVFISIMKVIDPLLFGTLKKFRSIPAAVVAAAMFKQSLKNEVGVFVHPTDKIKLLA
jgi:uncharacterized protein YbjT (DUF2867 family)